MRQDPEVVMVGEIRDPETAAIAVQAGLTGHLVISTIHSGVSAGAFTRMINMEIEPFMLASSHSRRYGPAPGATGSARSCAQSHQPEPSQLKVVPEALLAEGDFPPGRRLRAMRRTGFSGRLPVSELLAVSEPFREAVLKKMPTRALEEIAIQNGMRTLWQNGLYRAISGQTTLDETIRVLAADMI